MLYFDHSATTPPADEVIEVIGEVMKKYYGNPSSLHRLGVEAEKLLKKAREVIAQAISTASEEIIFTSGGTESNNLAIKGTAFRYRNRGNHLITTMVEHASVYETFQHLEKFGYEVTYLPVDKTGKVRVEDVRNAITENTILVSVMHVNNEVGTIQPIAEIGQLLRHYPKIIFHTDAVQALGKKAVAPRESDVDLMSVSAHKIRGPKGIGFLYKRKGIDLDPLITGGGQEFGWRSGTENVAMIVAMAKAVRMAAENQPQHFQKLTRLKERALEQIRHIPELTLNGSNKLSDTAPHIIHFSFSGMKSEVVVHALEQHGMYISTKSACSSSENKPSRVLLAMGKSPEEAISGLRVSMSAQQSEEDVDQFVTALKKVVRQFKEIGHRI